MNEILNEHFDIDLSNEIDKDIEDINKLCNEVHLLEKESNSIHNYNETLILYYMFYIYIICLYLNHLKHISEQTIIFYTIYGAKKYFLI